MAVDREGNPVAGAKLSARYATTESDARGEFELPHLRAGRYWVHGQGPDGALFETLSLELDEGEIKTVRIVLQPEGGRIRAVVVDTDGTPVVGASVVRKTAGLIEELGTTDGAGVLEASGQADGMLVLFAFESFDSGAIFAHDIAAGCAAGLSTLWRFSTGSAGTSCLGSCRTPLTEHFASKPWMQRSRGARQKSSTRTKDASSLAPTSPTNSRAPTCASAWTGAAAASTTSLPRDSGWRTVKYEDIYINDYDDVPAVYAGLNRYWNFCNTDRLHQSLRYKTPEQVHFAAAA